MIHGGVRDTITLQFRKLAPQARSRPAKLLAAERAGLSSTPTAPARR